MLQQVFYRGPARQVLHEDYAKKGKIDEQAPIKTSSSVVINASAEHVWRLLSNPPAWSSFTDSIKDIELESDLSVDSTFRFRLYNFPIRARVAVIRPQRELTWTGASLWFTAIDRHILTPENSSTTRLTIVESFSGVLAVPLMSQARLKTQHEAWLSAFKRAAERS